MAAMRSRKAGGWLAAIEYALTWPARTRSYGIIVTLALTSLVVVALLHVWTRLEVIRIGKKALNLTPRRAFIINNDYANLCAQFLLSLVSGWR